MLKTKFGIFCLLLPAISAASPIVQCKSYSFLKPAFSLDNYKNCYAHIQQCPQTGPVLDQNCVKHISKKDIGCRQLKELSNVINADLDTVKVEFTDRYALIDQVFPADGQHNYYIISPKGCLVNTKIDPRNLNPALKKQYKNQPLIIVNWDKPKFQANPNGTSSYTALLKVTKNCLACEIAGWAEVKFEFTKNGNLKKTTLEKFTKEKPTDLI